MIGENKMRIIEIKGHDLLLSFSGNRKPVVGVSSDRRRKNIIFENVLNSVTLTGFLGGGELKFLLTFFPYGVLKCLNRDVKPFW